MLLSIFQDISEEVGISRGPATDEIINRQQREQENRRYEYAQPVQGRIPT